MTVHLFVFFVSFAVGAMRYFYIAAVVTLLCVHSSFLNFTLNQWIYQTHLMFPMWEGKAEPGKKKEIFIVIVIKTSDPFYCNHSSNFWPQLFKFDIITYVFFPQSVCHFLRVKVFLQCFLELKFSHVSKLPCAAEKSVFYLKLCSWCCRRSSAPPPLLSTHLIATAGCHWECECGLVGLRAPPPCHLPASYYVLDLLSYFSRLGSKLW